MRADLKATVLRIIRLGRRLATDTGGNIAIVFALVLPLLIMITLGGVDISRASTVKMNLQDALDAATLAAARSQFTDNARITEVGMNALRANLAPFPEIQLLEGQSSFRLNTTTGAVQGDAIVSVDTLVADIVLPPYGAVLEDRLPVRARSEVLRSNNRIEVALVLDNTGSMAGQKLTNTKAAAIDLINRLEAADNRSIEADAIKISLVPFSMTVRVAQGGTSTIPSYMSNATNHTGATGSLGLFSTGVGRFTLFQDLGTTWGGCVEARPQPFDIRDTAPTTSNQATMFVPYFAPDEPDRGDYPNDSTWQSWLNSSNSDQNDYLNDTPTSSYGTSNASNPMGGNSGRRTMFFNRLKERSKYNTTNRRGAMTADFGPNNGCTLQPIIRLTDNYNALRTAVNNMVATGNTNVPLGAMWGWHTLSPNAPFGDGRPYGSERLQKIIIIMTDGENVMSDNNSPNDSFYNGLGYIWQERLGMGTGSDSARRQRMDERFDHSGNSQEDLCGNMKAAGIEVYTVAVQVDTQAQTLMRRCASSSDHYFPVNNASGIGAAFDRIAGAIENLRISR
ncbi:pilus assembly protein [Brevundimonas bacteroides]|uniref:pilus assembly protein n=1 Tax=Brevundimonas bacteroides TaxID=74311 RepID=UPI000A0724BF|nr:pilus assembly protein [Brevundimonas bacteroides]